MSLTPLKITAIRRNENGTEIIFPGASVSINAATGGAYAVLKGDYAGTIPVSNPFVCDPNGEKQVYLQAGDYFVSVAGGSSWAITVIGSSDVRAVDTVAAMRALTPSAVGQQFNLLGHTVAGFGGGLFYYDSSDAVSADNNGTVIVTTGGHRIKRYRSAQPSIYDFGFIDGGVDSSVAINACTIATGECWLDGGKTYNLQFQINGKILKARGGSNATLNLTSPTANTRWGGPTSSFGNTAAFLALGGVGSPLQGVDVQNITVNCNSLIGATGSTGIKGFMFARCQDFYHRGCTVLNCASYAFWDYDVATTGTTYCSGTRDDCWAINASVSFEQVNVRGVTLNNCHALITGATLSYTVEFMFHPYGGSDMQVVYNNCTGIAEQGSGGGGCPSILGALLECKNVTANDCQFINKQNGGAAIRSAVYLESAGGNFDRINFKNCILRADFFASVLLTPGASGAATASFAFTDCNISGKSIGAQFNGTGGYYSFVDCITTGTSISGGTAFGYNTNATGAVVQVTGGRATGTGGTSPLASNLPASSFNGTIQTPSSGAIPRIRQQANGIVTMDNNTTYASKTVAFPFATVDATKVFVTALFNSSAAGTGPAAAAIARPVSFFRVDATNYRFYADTAAAGFILHYTLIEYE